MIKQTVKTQSPSALAALTAAGYDELTARLLINRGCATPEEADTFISAESGALHSPFLLPDMDRATGIIKKAIAEKRRITVYGDYDVDGITSITILYTFLKSLGVDVGYYIPHRIEEGYGINKNAVDRIANDGTTLMITVDTGTAAAEEIEYAVLRGIECVVTDHHECAHDAGGQDILPGCPVVNPKRSASVYPFKELAGVGVTFKLITALSDEGTAAKYTGYTAIGTIADIMPLTGENRLLVTRGIAMLNSDTPPGIQALAEASGCDGKPLDAGAVAFRLAPRLNAAGRVGDPSVSVELLTARSGDEAKGKAARLCEENALRQKTENGILLDVEKRLANKKISKIIIERSEKWHNGVIGIVASRLTEIYNRPCILFCSDGTTVKGSARSVPGVNIYGLLSNSATGLSRFGGHEMAAGLTVREEDFEDFRNAVTEYADKTIPDSALCAVCEAECQLTCREASLDTFDRLNRLEPFGSGNPLPAFAFRQLKITEVVGISQNKYSRLTFTDCTGASFTALSFTRAPSELSCGTGDEVNVICTLGENIYRGTRCLSAIIKTMELSDTEYGSDNAESYERSRVRYLDFKDGGQSPCPPVTRNDVAAVYRLAAKPEVRETYRVSPLAYIRTLNRKGGCFDYAKLRVCLDILTEIGLIEHTFVRAKAVSEDEILTLKLLPTKKSELSASHTYREMQQRAE